MQLNPYRCFYESLLHSFRLTQMKHNFTINDLNCYWGLTLREMATDLQLVTFNSFKLSVILRNIDDKLLQRLFGGIQRCNSCGNSTMKFLFDNENCKYYQSVCHNQIAAPICMPLQIFISYYKINGKVHNSVYLSQQKYVLQSVFCFDLQNQFKASMHLQEDTIVVYHDGIIDFLSPHLFKIYRLDSTVGRLFKLFGQIKYATYSLVEQLQVQNNDQQTEKIVEEQEQISQKKEIIQSQVEITQDFELQNSEIQRWRIIQDDFWENNCLNIETNQPYTVKKTKQNEQLKKLLIKNQVFF